MVFKTWCLNNVKKCVPFTLFHSVLNRIGKKSPMFSQNFAIAKLWKNWLLANVMFAASYVVFYMIFQLVVCFAVDCRSNSHRICTMCLSLVVSGFTRLIYFSWWCHQMVTFYALLSLCEGNPPITGGFPWQRPMTRSFDVFLWFAPEQTAEQTIEKPAIWGAIALIMT